MFSIQCLHLKTSLYAHRMFELDNRFFYKVKTSLGRLVD